MPALAAAASTSAEPAGTHSPTYTLPELEQLMLDGSASVAAERARVQAAEAAVTTARAWPNPEVEWTGGRLSARAAGVNTGSLGSVSLTQPIERPALRSARQNSAQASLDGTRRAVDAQLLDLLAQLRLRYHEILLRQAERQAAKEDLALANQIRDRVRARVNVGEAPRFELFRAESEQLNAQRRAQATELRIQQARAELRRLIGPRLSDPFRIKGHLAEPLESPPDWTALKADLLKSHPQVAAARAEVQAAQARLELERSQRLPTFAVRGGMDREPDTRATRVGVVMSVPLFDRRAGHIAQAAAEVERARALLADRELQLTQSLEVAARQYELATGQVSAFENGIVRESEAAMKVAEAAYRFGERGILDYLDAQRSLRQVRNDLNQARYEQRAALVELQRLQAQLP